MGTKIKFKDNISKPLYDTLLFFLVFISVLNSSALPFGKIYSVYNLLCIVICLILFYKRKRSKKLRHISIIILIAFTCSAITTKDLTMLSYALFIITAEKDFSRLVRTAFIGTWLGLLLVVPLAVCGIIPDYTYVHLGKTVHSFGFYYYSAIPYYILFTSLMYIYLKGKRLKLLEILVIYIFQYIAYKLFCVRLTFYIGMIMIALTLLFIKFNIGNLNHAIIKGISAVLFPLSTFISCEACIKYRPGNHIWDTLNSAFNNRISQGYSAFNNYSVKLLGQQIKMRGTASLALGVTSGEYFYIDSGYVYSVLLYGLFFTIILLIVYSLLMVKICEINNKQLYVWMLAVMIFSFLNNALININMNPLLLCIPYLFQQGSKPRKEFKSKDY